jgi:hypothetical protein
MPGVHKGQVCKNARCLQEAWRLALSCARMAEPSIGPQRNNATAALIIMLTLDKRESELLVSEKREGLKMQQGGN